MEQLDVQAPTSRGPVIPSNWFVTDAILISAFTALTYLVAFKYEQAYLGYFAVSEQFVDLSLERVVLVFSVLLVILTGLYQLLNALFLFSHASLRIVFACFIFELILIGLGALLYFGTGFNWATVVTLSLLTLLLFFDLILVGQKLWRGHSLKDWLNARQETYWSAPPRPDLDSIIIDRIGLRNWAVIPLGLLLFPNLGTIAGDFSASHKKVFESYSLGKSDAVLIGQRGDTWLFAEISNSTITGKLSLRKVDPANPLILDQKIYLSGTNRVGRSKHKPSFYEWWNGNEAPHRFGR